MTTVKINDNDELHKFKEWIKQKPQLPQNIGELRFK